MSNLQLVIAITGSVSLSACLSEPVFSPEADAGSVDTGGDFAGQAFLGADQSCAVRTDGPLHCWGDNRSGQLGVGDRHHRSVPTRVEGTAIRAVAIGLAHACALSDDGLQCWGRGDRGALGVGDRQSRLRDTVIGTFAAVAAGDEFTCAVTPSGDVSCWGANELGQLGQGAGGSFDDPQAVLTPERVRVLGAGGRFACAIPDELDGVFCWGANESGQLGRGSQSPSEPLDGVQTSLSFSGLSLGDRHACAVSRGGTVHCWGGGDKGQLGNGALENVGTPIRVAPLVDIRMVAAGRAHTCALENTGALYCWGDNRGGQVSEAGGFVTTPTAVATDIASVVAGGDHTCAVGNDSNLRCWGSDTVGQLGLGAEVVPAGETTVPITLATPIGTNRLVSMQDRHACASTTAIGGELVCWGDNTQRQLRATQRLAYSSPLVLTADDATVRNLGVGRAHTCVESEAGRIDCWGRNIEGQIGRPSSRYEHGEIPRVDGAPWTRLSVGGYLSAAVTTSAIVPDAPRTRIWGTFSEGVVVVGSDVPFAASDRVASGDRHVCLHRSGVECLGQNEAGQLGNGTKVAVDPVGGLATEVVASALSVAAAGSTTCAVLASGSVSCWGDGSHGLVGGASMETAPTAIPLQGAVADQVALSLTHACVHLTDDSVACWGSGAQGQLGASVDDSSATPVIVNELSGATRVHVGTGITCARIGDQLTCIGSDEFGLRGQGRSLSVASPQVVVVP